MKIRLLDAPDAQVYREIRLRALRNDPQAFGSAYEEERTRPLLKFAERIEYTNEQFTLGCFDDSHSSHPIVGIVNFVRENRRKTAHKGNIYGMYIDPEYRGRGFGKSLIVALIEKAISEFPELEQIHLTVVSNNALAKQLYLSLGFDVYGVEPNALKIDGRYFDEELMILRIKRS